MVPPTTHPIHELGAREDMDNYWTIMVDHTFSKLYATTLHLQLCEELERRHLQARGHERFREEHQTLIISSHYEPSLRRLGTAL
jgi:hypothetical protein